MPGASPPAVTSDARPGRIRLAEQPVMPTRRAHPSNTYSFMSHPNGAFTCRADCKERDVSKNRNGGLVKCNALFGGAPFSQRLKPWLRASGVAGYFQVKRIVPPGVTSYAGAVSYTVEGGCPGGSAVGTVPGEYFVPAMGRLAFAPGETATTIPVTILDDRIPEGYECMDVRFSDAQGDAAAGSGIGNALEDNDPQAARPTVKRPRAQRVLKQRAVIVAATSNADGTLAARGTIAIPSGAAAAVRAPRPAGRRPSTTPDTRPPADGRPP